MLLPMGPVTGNLPARQRHLCAHWATTAPPHHSGCFLLQVMENPAKRLKDWGSSLYPISTVPGRVGSGALHQQLSDVRKGSGSFQNLPSHGCPRQSVAAVVRDTGSQRTSSWFTFSKRVTLFPFVVLSLRGRWFFPRSLHWTSHVSETDSTESHDHFMINPQKIGWRNSINNLDKTSGLRLIWSVSLNILDTLPQFYLLKYILKVFTSLVSKLP